MISSNYPEQEKAANARCLVLRKLGEKAVDGETVLLEVSRRDLPV